MTKIKTDKLKRICNYLQGTQPPYYDGNKKITFLRQLQKLDKNIYSNNNLDFWFKQLRKDDNDFYYSILYDFILDNHFEKTITLFKELKIPTEIMISGKDFTY